jgi:aminoglycoside phosphotransferase (APT) family kinase protein
MDELEKQLQGIAAAVFARYGVDFASARRALGWSNATWLAGGLALRMAVQPGNDRLFREARLAALLPAQAGYPRQVESGATDGFAWVLSQEVAGQPLGQIWPGLNWADRQAALCQLWEKAEAVHSVDVQAAAPLARQRAWFNSTDAAAADAATRRLLEQGLFTLAQADALAFALRCFWQALASAVPVLNHGDLTLDNTLWRDGQVVCLLDFEYAVLAPAALDLNVLLTCVFGPDQDEPDPLGRDKAQRALARLAAPLLAQPGGADLLLGYAILLEQWHLEDWLAHPDGEGPLEQWEPYRRLLSLADGQGGYLAALLQLK